MNLQDFINNATELANTIIESGLYEESDSVYQTAQQVVKDSESDLDYATRKHYSDTDRIILVWGIDDVIAKASDNGIELTDEEAWDILSHIESKHDASIGVNWDVIWEYINMR